MPPSPCSSSRSAPWQRLRDGRRTAASPRPRSPARREGLVVVVLAGIFAFSLASAWDVLEPFPPPGSDWSYYLLHADEVESRNRLLVENPYDGDEDRLFSTQPAVGAVYGSLRILDGVSSRSLARGLAAVSAFTPLGVYAAVGGLWGAAAGLLAASAYAVAPIRLEPLYWHGLATTLALLFLSVVLPGARSAVQGRPGSADDRASRLRAGGPARRPLGERRRRRDLDRRRPRGGRRRRPAPASVRAGLVAGWVVAARARGSRHRSRPRGGRDRAPPPPGRGSRASGRLPRVRPGLAESRDAPRLLLLGVSSRSCSRAACWSSRGGASGGTRLWPRSPRSPCRLYSSASSGACTSRSSTAGSSTTPRSRWWGS